MVHNKVNTLNSEVRINTKETQTDKCHMRQNFIKMYENNKDIKTIVETQPLIVVHTTVSTACGMT